jgi:hypothetical protein
VRIKVGDFIREFGGLGLILIAFAATTSEDGNEIMILRLSAIVAFAFFANWLLTKLGLPWSSGVELLSSGDDEYLHFRFERPEYLTAFIAANQ